MKKETKSSYSVLSSIGFMVKTAWGTYKQVLVLCVLYGLFDLMVNVVQLFVAPTVLRQVQSGVTAAQLIQTILMFAGLLFLANAGKSYTDDNSFYGRIAVRSVLSRRMEDHFATTSYPNTQDPDYLALTKRVKYTINSNSAATEAIWETLGWILRDGLGLIIYLFVLAKMPVILLIISLLTSVAAFLVSRKMNQWEHKHREEREKLDKKAGYLRDKPGDTALGKDIRIFGMGNWLEALHQSVLRAYMAFQAKKQKRLLIGNIVEILTTFLRNGLAYYYLIRLILAGTIDTPQFLLYFTAFSGLTQWITGLLNDFLKLHTQSLDLSLYREYMDHEEIFSLDHGKTIYPEPIPYTLTLENVSFRYPGAEEDTIHHMNLTIHGGEKVAVVGLNGAGKTTLVKLLCGFEDPTEGRVLLNGQDIREFNRRQYYQLFTAVFQQFATINGTIEENVAMRIEGIDADKVTDCLKKADLMDKVRSLPQGAKTHLGKEVFEDGITLSEGETQRLILARALYKGAPILILDEPTAALDPIAEDHIYHSYDELAGGHTSVFISHRLASTRFCDRILMLEKGRIVEDGTHDALLEQHGPYAQLFEIQSRYYKEDATTGGSDREE